MLAAVRRPEESSKPAASPVYFDQLRPAHADDLPVTSPVHDQHAHLQRAFAENARGESYSGLVKLAILFGTSFGLWGGILAGGTLAIHALVH